MFTTHDQPSNHLEHDHPPRATATTRGAGVAIVVGGQSTDLAPADLVILAELLQYLGVGEVWHGDSAGVDACADGVARSLDLFVRTFPARVALGPSEVMHDRQERILHAAQHAARSAPVFVITFPGDEWTGVFVSMAAASELTIIDLRGRR